MPFLLSFSIISSLVIQLVPSIFSTSVQTGGAIERRYIQMGRYEVSYFRQEVKEDFKTLHIYYPSEIGKSQKTFPLVVMVNGTWAEASKYTMLFKHLASWGFVVVGNDAGKTWDGEASVLSLK